KAEIGIWGRSGDACFKARGFKFVQKFRESIYRGNLVSIYLPEKFLFLVFQLNEFLLADFPSLEVGKDVPVVFSIHVLYKIFLCGIKSSFGQKPLIGFGVKGVGMANDAIHIKNYCLIL